MRKKEGAALQKKEIGSLLLEHGLSLSREKGLSFEVVLDAIERSLEKVFESKYGNERRIRVSLSEDGVIHTFLSPPKEKDPDSSEEEGDREEGDREENLPLPEFDRLSVRTLKKALSQNLQIAERALFYEEFKDRVGQVVFGTVRQVSGDLVSVSLGRAEGVMMRKDMIPGEHFRVGSRVKVYICDVQKDAHGPQILLSRSHKQFLVEIMTQEIPEIQDGSIEIRSVARDPGSRAKVAVFGDTGRSDAVGACIGAKGSRIRAISEELNGEKIDVLMWSSDLPSFVVNALNPAEISKVVVEDESRVRVIVEDDQLGIAIGRSGQNVRLAHSLTGVNIDIVTEEQYREKKEKERNHAVSIFMDALDLDNMMALLLVSEGFETVEDLIDDVKEEDLARLPGMNMEIAQELQIRARDALKSLEKNAAQSFIDGGGDQALIDLGIPFQVLLPLSKGEILTVKNFSDLSLCDLFDVVGSLKSILSEEEWGNLIMKGRGLDG